MHKRIFFGMGGLHFANHQAKSGNLNAKSVKKRKKLGKNQSKTAICYLQYEDIQFVTHLHLLLLPVCRYKCVTTAAVLLAALESGAGQSSGGQPPELIIIAVGTQQSQPPPPDHIKIEFRGRASINILLAFSTYFTLSPTHQSPAWPVCWKQ